jgi:DHA1 family bicyclomycin/chloramphenicol resistance-like MFS transporter
VLTSLAATLADSFTVMIAARAVQGAALSAAVVCGRAMVRDLYAPEDGARMMTKGMAGLGVIALVGPILGGLAATHGGWRATMGLLALCGVILLAFVWRWLPETLPDERRQHSLRWRNVAGQWWDIARHPTFRAHAMLTSATYGGLYGYLALSSFVFIDQLGVSRTGYGVIMACTSLSYLSGTWFCRRHLPAHGLVGTVRKAGLVSIAAGLWLAGLSAWQFSRAEPVPFWTLLPGMWLYSFAHGIHQPCGQTGVVAAFPLQAGAASALSGFVLATVAFAVGVLLSGWSALPAWSDTLYPMTLSLALGAAITARVALHRVQRDGLVSAAA